MTGKWYWMGLWLLQKKREVKIQEGFLKKKKNPKPSSVQTIKRGTNLPRREPMLSPHPVAHFLIIPHNEPVPVGTEGNPLGPERVQMFLGGLQGPKEGITQ